MPDLLLVGNAKSGTISVLRQAADRLEPVATNTVGVGCSTFAVNGDLVFSAVKQPEPAIVTLTLDRTTGVLTETARRTVDDSLTYLTLARDGSVLLGASYGGDWGGAWPVNADGSLGEAPSRVGHANLHCVVANDAGDRCWFVSLGDNLIAPCALTGDATLTPLPSTSVTAGMGPRHMVLSADESLAYVVTEFTGAVVVMRVSADGTLAHLQTVDAVDPSTGLATSRFGADPKAEHLIWGADLHLAHDGRYLVTSERTESTLTTLAIGDDGLIDGVVTHTPCEAQPRGFAVAPDGRHLVVAGEASGHVALMRIEDGGTIIALDRVHTGEGPNWVHWV